MKAFIIIKSRFLLVSFIKKSFLSINSRLLSSWRYFLGSTFASHGVHLMDIFKCRLLLQHGPVILVCGAVTQNLLEIVSDCGFNDIKIILCFPVMTSLTGKH